MNTFKSHLREKTKESEFRHRFNEQRDLLRLAVRVQEFRERHGMSQSALARRAGITQQQLSRLENGTNCNVATFLRVCHALKVRVTLKSERVRVSA